MAWGRFVGFVQYKADWLGKNVIICDRFAPSSKLYSCDYKNDHLTLADRTWICPECKLFHDRGQLAARNIRRFALEKFAEAAGSADDVKCSSVAIPISVGAVAKGAGLPVQVVGSSA